jgi:hypothetical protein
MLNGEQLPQDLVQAQKSFLGGAEALAVTFNEPAFGHALESRRVQAIIQVLSRGRPEPRARNPFAEPEACHQHLFSPRLAGKHLALGGAVAF